MISQATGKRIGCVGHDCDECSAVRAALSVALTTLEQIATTPRNKGARRNAYSTLAFLRTQLTTPNADVTGLAPRQQMNHETLPAHGSVDVNVSPLPCPFCGKPADLEDNDTLYPTGCGWKFDEELQMRTYHRYTEAPTDQWCWGMHCPTCAGGCGAEIHGDSKEEAIAKWNKRANFNVTGAEPEGGASGGRSS